MIELSEKEETLVITMRSLPPDTADQILNLISRLAELADGKPLDYSDDWTEEDMRDATATALHRFDEEEH